MHETTSQFSAFDGLQLFERTWAPDESPRAVVAVVHGYSEHSGRYQELSQRLTDAGYAVSLFDLRGHGKSAGARAFVRSFDEYVRDLQSFIERLREREPDLPLFLLGHSMGGLIAALWTLKHGSTVRGLALSAAALKVSDEIHPWLQRFSAVIGAAAPRLPTIRFNDAFLSRRAEVVQAYRDDPLVYHGRMLARTGAELVRNSREIAGRVSRITAPLLAMHGSADRLTDPAGSRRLYEQAASSDKTFKLYEGLYHELLHEPERQQVMTDLVDWLRAHC